MALTDAARAMREQGIDVIGLAAGEPDFDTPEAIVAAGIEALRTGKTRYTPNTGTSALRAAIAKKLMGERESGVAASERLCFAFFLRRRRRRRRRTFLLCRARGRGSCPQASGLAGAGAPALLAPYAVPGQARGEAPGRAGAWAARPKACVDSLGAARPQAPPRRPPFVSRLGLPPCRRPP